MVKKISILILLFSSIIIGVNAQTKNPGERLSASETAHSLQKNKASVNPNVNPNNLINIDKSGDVSMAVPLVTVQGRKLQLPIQLNYQAGIKVNQKSSEVGLGWSINFGSIVRDYGAFEPDYAETTAETKMENTISSTGGANFASPSSPYLDTYGGNHQNPYYDGILQSGGTDKQKMTPDDYHINIPGVGSNTFWNNSGEGATTSQGNSDLDFIFNNYQPWKIEYKIKNYEIDQEYSRINELTFHRMSTGELRGAANIAAAILIPPYVKNRDFRGVVPYETAVPFQSGGLAQSSVKYDDFEQFAIVTEDGTKYIFGRALRGQKYVFTEDPFWSTHVLGSTGNGASHGEFWKMDYIAEWLLTEVRSIDYVDVNGNGPDDKDDGDWIIIEYTYPTAETVESIPGSHTPSISVPRHREWMNFTQTDRYSSLMRERAYVEKITTPVQEIVFDKSKKMDVDHDYFETILNDPYGGVDYYYSVHGIQDGSGVETSLKVDYPVELYKYDKITITEKTQDDVLYPRNKITNTIVLNYAEQGSSEELAVSEYLIRKNDNEETISYNPMWNGPFIAQGNNVGFNIEDYLVTTSGYNGGEGRGKTTLLGLDFFPEDNLTTSDKRSYKFEYGNNPSFSDIHKYEILKANGFPSLRESKITNTTRGLPKNVKTSLSNYTMEQFRFINGGTIEQYSNLSSNAIGIDEMGYYYDPAETITNNRDAWSLTKVILPTGGTIELEYELDEFDYDGNGDRARWFDKGSLLDDRLPHVAHYNKLAQARSVAQDRVNIACGVTTKELYRSFSYPMKRNSGGLRLKKKILNDGINPTQNIIYNYGDGHFTSVPGSYWNNYTSAFSSFMLAERVRQEGEAVYDYSLISGGWISENDFNTHMAPLSMNMRLDNTVKDNHYYEYIEEIKQLNSSGSNPSIKKWYGNPYLGIGVPYFDEQKAVWIKGLARSLGPVTQVITNNVEREQAIKLLKIEKYESGISTPYETTTFNWTNAGDASVVNHVVKYGGLTLANYNYYIWEKDGSGKLIQLTPPQSGFVDFWLNSLVSLITYPPYIPGSTTVGSNPIDNLAHQENVVQGMVIKLGYGGSSCYGVRDVIYISDNDFIIPAQSNFVRQQSIKQNLIKTTKTYKGVETVTDYTYEPAYNLLKTTTVENSKYIDAGGTTISPKTINEITYAFEAYDGISTKFIDNHMLNQVSQSKQYAGTVTNANLLKSSVQNWDVGLINTIIPKPKKSYTFNGVINNDGKILNFVPFDFHSFVLNDNKWQEQNEGIFYNQFGQPTLSKTNNIYTRNVFGYSSTQPKSIISYTGGKFDATYTGFEDHYENDITYDLGERNEEEFWYENQNFGISFDGLILPVELRTTGQYPFPYDNLLFHPTNTVSSAEVPCSELWERTYDVRMGYPWVPPGSPSGMPVTVGVHLLTAFYVNDEFGKLQQGSQVTISMNPQLNYPSGNIADFTTTIAYIEELDPLPYTWIDHITGLPTITNSNLDDFDGKYKHLVCFSDQLPNDMLSYLTSWTSTSNPSHLVGMLIKSGSSSLPRTSKIVNGQSHTGNSSYHLSHKGATSEPSQTTPVRPVKISPLGE